MWNLSKPPTGASRLTHSRGDAFDVIKVMQHMVRESVKNPVLQEFVRRNPMNAKQIFNFAYGVASFKPDTGNKNSVKSPLRTFISHRANCVCYSVLIATLLKLNGIPGYFRAIRERDDWRQPKPKHIYVKTDAGQTLDASLGQDMTKETSRRDRPRKIGIFDREAKYFSKFDKRF